MTDNNAFSAIDEAIWSVLQADANLDTWRKAQSGSGNYAGKDFDTGEIPDLDKLPVGDLPALIVDSGGATPPENSEGTGTEYHFVYPVAIRGVTRRERTHVASMKKSRRFAELIWRAIANAGRTYFSGHLDGTLVSLDLITYDGFDFVQITEAHDSPFIASVLLNLQIRITIT